MNESPEMLDFVKAMSDADRLRIIGLLSQRSANQSEIAEQLGLAARVAFNHLAFLEHVGAIAQMDGVYELKEGNLEKLARSQLSEERPVYDIPPEFDEKSRKILVAYLKRDGRVKQLPSQLEKLRVVLGYILQGFAPEVNYTEKEVNIIIKRFHDDYSSVRRYLIDAGLLAREGDGSRYWRTS